jgi:hypothetical protein
MSSLEPEPTFDSFRTQAGLTLSDLWWRYFGVGGNATPSLFASFMNGTTQPDRADHDFLAQALNDRFISLGQDSPVPYFDDSSTLR